MLLFIRTNLFSKHSTKEKSNIRTGYSASAKACKTLFYILVTILHAASAKYLQLEGKQSESKTEQ